MFGQHHDLVAFLDRENFGTFPREIEKPQMRLEELLNMEANDVAAQG